MYKKIILTLAFLLTISYNTILANQDIDRYTAPNVSDVTESSATFMVPYKVSALLELDDKSQIYFEYYETNQVCIMIYPTPEYCLPKKTKIGDLSVKINNLKASTSYTVAYKRDNSIRCITTPCPTNDFASISTEFTTKANTNNSTSTYNNNIQITKNLWLGSRGSQVTTLQNVLIAQGHMSGSATGYFGMITFKAVKKFQRAHNIPPTGFVGKLTRAVLNEILTPESYN